MVELLALDLLARALEEALGDGVVARLELEEEDVADRLDELAQEVVSPLHLPDALPVGVSCARKKPSVSAGHVGPPARGQADAPGRPRRRCWRSAGARLSGVRIVWPCTAERVEEESGGKARGVSSPVHPAQLRERGR